MPLAENSYAHTLLSLPPPLPSTIELIVSTNLAFYQRPLGPDFIVCFQQFPRTRAPLLFVSAALSADFLFAICKCHHTISIVGAKNVHEHSRVSGRTYYSSWRKNHLFYLVPISCAQHFLCSGRTKVPAKWQPFTISTGALLAKHGRLVPHPFGRLQNRDACLHYSFGGHQRNSLFAVL